MTPAAECIECGAKWKTAHEPAEPEEMDRLLANVADHGANNAVNMAKSVIGIANKVLGASEQNEELSKTWHVVRMRYHSETPAERFEKAKVVTTLG